MVAGREHSQRSFVDGIRKITKLNYISLESLI